MEAQKDARKMATRSDYFTLAAEAARQAVSPEPALESRRCALSTGHGGEHFWVRTRVTERLLGECPAVWRKPSAGKPADPTPEQVAEWQKELDADMSAADRVPVAVMEGRYSLPLAICRDGSVHQMVSLPDGPRGGREWGWQSLPPIPGSPADLRGGAR